MKKIFGLMLLCVAIGFTSCKEEYVPQEVELTLGYTFAESGSMTRATGNEVYTDFYNKYIMTKVLTPKTYSLTFTNKDVGTVMKIDGNWDSADMIRLMEGNYIVEGTSHRVYTGGLDVASEYLSDTTFLSFNQEIQILANQTMLNLSAQYDSYLLMFDSATIEKITYKGIKSWSLNSHDDLVTLFVNRQSKGNSDDYIQIQRTNGSMATVYLKDIPFEKGKYYYFNDMTNSFDIPPMESGN